ncbi:MAG TPA: M1 family aminopeptidase [Gemmatimonadaceae bacterium]|nr:M1 family aminopeptidase [Gemmatimonadaceae bacterium]
MLLALVVVLAAAPVQGSPVSARPSASPDSLARFMEPGVSLELARHRASQLREVRYDLTLDVTSPEVAAGRVVVSFERVAQGDVILDFRGPSLAAVRANGTDVAGAQFNGAHIRIPEAALEPGANRIELEFTAAIAPAGASIIRVDDPADEARYLYTLLVPADANQLFPCFDQPDLKAGFTLTLVTPRGWTAVSNAALVGSDSAAATATFRFGETERISTYLFAFAAGPWVRLSPTHGERDISIYVRRSRAGEAEVDTIAALNARALAWLEDYFGIPYPFHKLDLVLAPAFPFGGMEHPGAIFYSEDRLIFRERPTLAQVLGRRALIYHEVAHQWFGDLVTMRWFDDLWLKEGFATYMAAKMQDALDPGTDAWKTFHLRNKPQAYGVDASAGTTPVWQSLANLDQAKSAYGPIVYNKAPAVLKQLEFLVGDRAFRDGVAGFLTRYRFGNATWRDLLESIGRAADRPLEPWGEQFILRPGMPVVEQDLELHGDAIAALRLVQQPARDLSGRGVWPMRVEVLLAYDAAPPVRLPVEITAETTVVAAAAGRRAPSFVFANAGDYGYALTLLDERSVAWLERGIGGVDDAMLRAMLWGALWDLVREARLAPARFIEIALRELPAERDEQIAASMLGQLSRATTAYLPDGARASFLPRTERVLRAMSEDDALDYGLRKLHLDVLIRLAATPPALAHIDSLLDGTHAAGEPLRPPTRWAIVTTLVARGAAGAPGRLAAETARDSTSEGARRAFVAGAAHADAATKRRYFERYLRDTTLNEDWATASLGAFNTIDQQALTLPFLRPALDTLPWIQRHRRIFFLSAWLGAFLGGQTSDDALAVVREFLDRRSDLPEDLRLKVLQAMDEMERTVRIRSESRGQSR